MLPIIQVGPVALQTPGLILIIGLWIGLSFSEKFSETHGITSKQIYDLSFILLISGMIGARFSEVVRHPSAFIENPASIISLSPALLDPEGGFALVIIAGMIYINRNEIYWRALLDALTPTLGTLAIALTLADLSAGSAFGLPTSLPWGIHLWGEIRHPTQIYLGMLAAFNLWLIWRARKKCTATPGATFFIWTAMTAGAVIFVERFRADSILIASGFRVAQIFAWSILAISLFQLHEIRTPKTAIK